LISAQSTSRFMDSRVLASPFEPIRIQARQLNIPRSAIGLSTTRPRRQCESDKD